MLAKKCDICGALYEPYNERIDPCNPSGFMLVNVCADGSYYESDIADCCPKCMAAIMDAINRLRPPIPKMCPDEPIGEW